MACPLNPQPRTPGLSNDTLQISTCLGSQPWSTNQKGFQFLFYTGLGYSVSYNKKQKATAKVVFALATALNTTTCRLSMARCCPGVLYVAVFGRRTNVLLPWGGGVGGGGPMCAAVKFASSAALVMQAALQLNQER